MTMTKALPGHPFNDIYPYADDLSLNERRLSVLLEIVEFKTDNLQELLEFTLEKVIAITNSKIGYIYFYDEQRRLFILNSWSKNVMKECSITEPMTEYELDKTGIWGEVVRQRKPVILNDYEAENPLKKGYPEGHVHLKKFLAIPVFYNDEIVANVGVANKETDYTDDDILQLKLLMDAVWKRIMENRISKKLAEEKEKAQLYLNIAPVMIVSLDMEGTVKMVNAEGLKIMQVDNTEILGKNWFDNFIPEVDRQKIRDVFEILKSGRDAGVNADVYENDVIDKNGGVHRMLWKNTIIRSEDGKAVELLSAGQELTHLKEMESSLLQAENKFENYIQLSPQGIFVANKEGKYTLVNKAACDMLGYTASELTSLGIANVISPEEKEKLGNGLTKVFQGEVVKDKYRMVRKDGSIMIMLVNAVLMPSQEVVAFCEDISKDEIVNIQLKEQNEQLQKMNQIMIERELKMVELKEQLKNKV